MFPLRVVAAALLLLGGVGCAVDREENVSPTAAETATAEVAADPFALGTALTAEGAIPREAVGATFGRGGEVYLSVNVEGASVEQAIEVKWVDPSGALLRRDEIEVPRGSQYAAFSSGETSEWKPGQHRAVIMINGRKVSERLFEVM